MIKPMQDRVLLTMDAAESSTPGGVVIPGNCATASQFGTVRAVGTGRVRPDGTSQPVALGIGARVLVQRYAGVRVTVDGMAFVIAREHEVMGVIDG